MATFERVRDVIDFSKNFHHRVSELYDRLSISSNDERIKMFLDYLSRHEENIEIQLNEFESGLSDDILDSWFSFLPEESKMKCFDDISLDNADDVDEVTSIALEMDKCLLSLYERIANATENHKVKDIFQNLYDMGSHDMQKLALSAQRLKSL